MAEISAAMARNSQMYKYIAFERGVGQSRCTEPVHRARGIGVTRDPFSDFVVVVDLRQYVVDS